MDASAKSNPELLAEIENLRGQLAEAQETLRAIRSGEVDALVVSTQAGDRVFTLQSADYSYRVLVESMNEGAVILAANGIVLYSNARFATMIKTPFQNVIGAEFVHFVTWLDTEKFNHHFQIGLQKESKTEINMMARDGSRLPVSISISLLQLESPIACVIVTDLTENKKAMQALQNEQKRLFELSQVERQQRLVAESLAQASLALTSTLDITKVFDHILEQIKRVIPFDVAHISLIDCDHFKVMRVLSQDTSWVFPGLLEYRFAFEKFALPRRILETCQTVVVNNTKMNSDFLFLPGWEWVRQYIGAPLISAGKVIGILTLFSDAPGKINPEQIKLLEAFANQAALAIQNARLYENLENSLQHEQVLRAQMIQTEKFAAIGRMVASITHELNNPLQSIKNCLYLTQEELGETNEHEYLGLAMQEVQRLSVLVAQLRDVYRPRQTPQNTWINLIEVLEQVKPLVAYELESSNITWQQNPLNGQFGVSGSFDQLKQVFLNIVWNAIQAMKSQGEGTLYVELVIDPHTCHVGVALRDTGPGIEPANLSKLFEPLFTTKSSGVGLGLPISLSIIQSHGGRIDVESQLKAGSKFTVWLPEAAQKPDQD